MGDSERLGSTQAVEKPSGAENPPRDARNANQKQKMSRFQTIVVVLLVIFVAQTLVITVGVALVFSGMLRSGTDVDRVRNMVLPHAGQYLYGTFFDAASGGTAEWEIFDARRGFPIVEVRGEVADPLRDALVRYLAEDGALAGEDVEDFGFVAQFLPSYETPEGFLSELLPSLTPRNPSRRWRIGYMTFSGVGDGSRYFEITEYLYRALTEVY